MLLSSIQAHLYSLGKWSGRSYREFSQLPHYLQPTRRLWPLARVKQEIINKTLHRYMHKTNLIPCSRSVWNTSSLLYHYLQACFKPLLFLRLDPFSKPRSNTWSWFIDHVLTRLSLITCLHIYQLVLWPIYLFMAFIDIQLLKILCSLFACLILTFSTTGKFYGVWDNYWVCYSNLFYSPCLYIVSTQ